MVFPEHFPAQCPPSDSEEPDESLQLYRAVSSPPGISDVLSNYESGQLNSDHCSGRGVSFSTKTVGLERNIERHPYFKGKVIARLQLKKRWGVYRKSKNKGIVGRHVNLWLYTETDREEIASALEVIT